MTRLTLLNLSPLPAEAIAPNLAPDLDIEIVQPADRTSAAAAEAAGAADLVLGDYQGEIAVTAETVARMGRVRLFHQPTTGYDLVDVDACAARGIPVTNAGAATSVALAEHTVMVTLALLKSLVWCDDRVRAGQWPQHDVVGRSLVDLQGKEIGLIGLGGAGEQTARRFAAFGCTLRYTARTRRAPDIEQALGVEWADLDSLLGSSDVVCLLVDLNPSTRNIIDGDAFARMKDGAFLVNAGRGGLVAEEALIQALEAGRLKGAALDVFATEPLPDDSPLRRFDNVILTPHVGGATLETRVRMLQRSFDVISQAARGELPDGVVNGVDALRMPG